MNKFVIAFFIAVITSKSIYANADSVKPARLIIRNAYILAIESSVAFASGRQLKHVYTFGQRAGIYLGFPIPKTGLNFGPEAAYTHFGNYINRAAVNRNHTFFVGLRANYFFVPSIKKKWLLFPSINIAYMGGKDVISPRKGYVGEPVQTYLFRGYVCALSFGFEISGFSMRLGYEVNRVNAFLSDVLTSQIKSGLGGMAPSLFTDLFMVQKPVKMNFDKVVLTITYNIHLKNTKR